MPPQIRTLTLHGGENKEETLYRLEKGWTLRFNLGPSLHAYPVRIFCNHPKDPSKKFLRSTYIEYDLENQTGSKVDRHDVYAEVRIFMAGSFNYFFTIDSSENNACGSGYFLVDPIISVGGADDDDEIQLDCVQCQSVLTKCLGRFEEWEGRLRVSKESGYNMIHFTPIQELGESNSAYSIRDQRHFSPVYSPGSKIYNCNDVERLVKKMSKEWKVLSLTDIVLNHTAKDSPWLLEHPECAYNLNNSPHLKPAYLMDRIFVHFNSEVAQGKWEYKGIPTKVDSEHHLEKMNQVLREIVFPEMKLEEFYILDIPSIIKKFKYAIEENRYIVASKPQLQIIQDPVFRRNKCEIDMDTALRLYNTDRPGVMNRQQRIDMCCGDLERKLQELNSHKLEEINDHINVAIDNFIANARYRYVDLDGPQLGIVTDKEPLMHNYFAQPIELRGKLDYEESCMYGERASMIMACNGWVMGDDPLRNFAEPGRTVYLRRELIAWGDSCKLRYGEKPEDCPYLWKLMKEYTETTARIFHGIRLDNCHSTPLHVAEYMMDAARLIRPDLYVVAELFTGNEGIDNIFMNKLGINSLIREAMNARNSNELGRTVYRYGGQPVGAFIQPRIQPLVPTVAHALLFDQTHDNKSPVETKSAYDLFPSAALVAMACCATGSNRGYDQAVPHHIHVVTEDRLYPSWADWDNPGVQHVNQSYGFTAGKTFLNNLHRNLGGNGYTQVFVDQLTDDTVSVTRHNPQTHHSVILVARTAFQHPEYPDNTIPIRPLIVQGSVTEVMFEGRARQTDMFQYDKNEKFINGLPNYYLEMRQHIQVSESTMVKVAVQSNEISIVSFERFTPGSVVVIMCELSTESKKAILEIRRGLGQFGYLMRSYSGRTIFDSDSDKSNFRSIVSNLSLSDLNRVLFRCDDEERADGKGFGAYDIPSHGPIVYCGLRGVLNVLNAVRPHNDLGHPVCNNLRDGDWLSHYIANRLKVHPGTEDLGVWFENVFKYLGKVPRYLIPCYFDAIVAGAYVVVRDRVFELMSDFITDGSTFVKKLAMGSVQFCGYVKTSKLPALSPKLDEPRPPVATDPDTKNTIQETLSLAAGFPHFASGYMRNWGRDTFIALRGLLLLTGRFQEARYIILSYGGTLRHGLIPNLLNEGSGARYNCRDAVWWWLQAIQDYCNITKDDGAILKDKVSRLYPTDDSDAQPSGTYDQPLHDVIQEALQRHAEGLKFTERNAGHSIDEQMSDEGFNIDISVNWEFGFVRGGNGWNCGTWMDKMGSSVRAGNKGKPATPRSGSAIELIGLCKSALRWLHEMNSKGKYPYDCVTAVEDGNNFRITFKDWGDKIQVNFERLFWINPISVPELEPHPELINRRGMYKDSYFADPFWSDFQLRPNSAVSMVVAPELFDPKHAWIALTEIEDILVGPLGVKTLDPRDWSYNGDYDNANDSEDPKIANGFNYHNGPSRATNMNSNNLRDFLESRRIRNSLYKWGHKGRCVFSVQWLNDPKYSDWEWLWPLGYFLRAKLHFAKILESEKPGVLKNTASYIKTKLSRHYEDLLNSPWQSLPELTNSNGKFCHDSCPAQAWSVGCILEVLYDLEQLEVKDEMTPRIRRSSTPHKELDVIVT